MSAHMSREAMKRIVESLELAAEAADTESYSFRLGALESAAKQAKVETLRDVAAAVRAAVEWDEE